MESPVVFVLLLVATIFTAGASFQIYASENPLPVGDNVTLSSQNPITTGAWMFNNEMIVMIYPGGQITTNTWINRVTFNLTTSSLTIMSLQLEDSGVYTLQGINSFRAQLSLSVQVPISNVSMRANATNLVEFNDTAVLMCSVLNGSSLSYVWLNGSSVVTTGSMVQLSNGGATLTIVSVTRYDQGPFRCNVSNGVSQEVSLPVLLNISYGPSNTTMTIMPMRSTYITGSNITLSCSADSLPPAMIQWMLDGMYLNQSGPQLQLQKVQKSNSGNYQCLIYNTVTLRFSSKSAMISILEPIGAVVVNNTGGPVILHERLILHCEATGVVASYQWWRNGQPITTDNTTIIENKTLIILSVQLSDNGNYQCQAFNSVSNMTSSPYMVEVNYGPQTPAIMGPTMAKTGDNATFSCYASSNPTASYKWFFNDSLVANTLQYVIPLLTKKMSGTYTCMAFNNITGKNSTAYTMLTVFDSLKYMYIETPMTAAIAGNSYYLMCNVSGPAGVIYWMKNGEPLHEDNRTVFSMDKKTVTFNQLRQNDTGFYQCMAIYAGGNMTSAPYMLIVNFGPETPIIEGPTFAEKGHYAVFECFAMSTPPSQYSWWFNGSEVSNTSTFKTDLLSLNMSGEYTCMAYNYITKKNSTNSKILTVVEPIKSVMIRNNTIPINSENFTLTCDVTGPYAMIYWIKDNMKLNMTNLTATPHMSYYIKNNMLHFTPLTMHSDGTYQCVATNHAGQHESPQYRLLVNFGPLSVAISGPRSAEVNQLVSFNCSANSRPHSNFQWFFNNNSVALNTGSVLTFIAKKGTEGNYTCNAMNPVTNITKSDTKPFTVSGHASAFHFPSQGVLMLMGLFALSVPVLFS